jgi:hypothetical protein
MCDCLVALGPATAAGATLFAKNSDRPPDEPQELRVLAARHDGGSLRCTHIDIEPWPHDTIEAVVSSPTWAWGAEHGVNAAGVAIGNETIYTTLDPRPAPLGLIGMDLVRLGLERATSATEAVSVMTDLLERYGQGGSGHRDRDRPYWSSFLLADPLRAFVIETSGSTWMAEPVERTRAISNRTTIAAFDAVHRHPRQPVQALVDPRLRASEVLLTDEPVSVDGLARHLRSHIGGDDGWWICMHVDGVESTTASLIAELPIDAAPRAWFGLGSPCTSPWTPVRFEQGIEIGSPVLGSLRD